MQKALRASEADPKPLGRPRHSVLSFLCATMQPRAALGASALRDFDAELRQERI
jgi:hypothetical protein